MVERQDIDALLVGALYGELTPADEARLSAHLESHPGDRSVFDGLKTARAAVRESRIFEVQLDPPQALSALLLQEAARRAPKQVVRAAREHAEDGRLDGWFTRFMRSFAAHPAMAAAATFVVVIGVAGTLYLRQGDELVADQRAERNASIVTPAGAPLEAQPTTTAAAGSAAYAVALDDSKGGKDRDTDNLNGVVADQHVRGVAAPKPAMVASPEPVQPAEPKHLAPAADPSAHKSIAVHTADRTPKDMDGDQLAFARADSEDEKAPQSQPQQPKQKAEQRSMPGTGAGAGPGGGAVAAQAPPPPPATTIARATPAPAKNDEASTWAQSQHQLLIATVKTGNCQDAGKIALGIRNRAPDYYNSYVASDRNLKSCMQYITDAADKDTERASKRASKRATTTDAK